MSRLTSPVPHATHEPSFLDDASTEEDVLKTRGAIYSSSFQRYLREISRYRLLSRQEERELFQRLKENGDLEARSVLISHNLRLVVSMAKRYQWSGIPIDDLVQEGNIGLMAAINRFDYTLGYKFSTYAHECVRDALGRHVHNKANIIRVPTHVHELHSRMMSHYEIDSTKIGVSRIAEIAQRFTVAPSAIVTALLSADQQVASLNDVIKDHPHEEEGSEAWSEEVRILQDTISGYEDDTPELLLRYRQELILACTSIKKIVQLVRNETRRAKNSERNLACFFHHHGLFCEETVTLKDLAIRYGVTKERVRQIVTGIIERLQEKDKTITGQSIVDLVRRIHELEKLAKTEASFLNRRS